MLHEASVQERTDVVRKLLQKYEDSNESPDIDKKPGFQSGFTALDMAAQNDHRDIAQMLIDKGAVYNQAARQQSPPTLCVAAFYGSHNVLQLQLEKGARTDVRDKESLTPLLLAAAAGRTLIVRALSKFGGPIYLPSQMRGTRQYTSPPRTAARLLCS